MKRSVLLVWLVGPWRKVVKVMWRGVIIRQLRAAAAAAAAKLIGSAACWPIMDAYGTVRQSCGKTILYFLEVLRM